MIIENYSWSLGYTWLLGHVFNSYINAIKL